jgi:hypothetical protein
LQLNVISKEAARQQKPSIAFSRSFAIALTEGKKGKSIVQAIFATD